MPNSWCVRQFRCSCLGVLCMLLFGAKEQGKAHARLRCRWVCGRSQFSFARVRCFLSTYYAGMRSYICTHVFQAACVACFSFFCSLSHVQVVVGDCRFLSGGVGSDDCGRLFTRRSSRISSSASTERGGFRCCCQADIKLIHLNNPGRLSLFISCIRSKCW